MRFDVLSPGSGLDQGRLAELMRAAYGLETPACVPTQYNWLYAASPAGPTRFAVALEGDAYAGCVGIAPTLFDVHGETVRCGFLLAVATHPEHQGKGLFKKLGRLAINAGYAEDQRMIFGFANPNAYPGWLRLGTRKIGNFIPLYRPVFPPIPFLGRSPATTASVAELMALDHRRADVGRSDTPEALAWRYDGASGSRFDRLVVDGPGGRVGVVARTVSKRGIRICEIFTWRSDKQIAPRDLSRAMNAIGRHCGAMLIQYRTMYPSAEAELMTRAGFFPRLGNLDASGVVFFTQDEASAALAESAGTLVKFDRGDADW